MVCIFNSRFDSLLLYWNRIQFFPWMSLNKQNPQLTQKPSAAQFHCGNCDPVTKKDHYCSSLRAKMPRPAPGRAAHASYKVRPVPLYSLTWPWWQGQIVQCFLNEESTWVDQALLFTTLFIEVFVVAGPYLRVPLQLLYFWFLGFIVS